VVFLRVLCGSVVHALDVIRCYPILSVFDNAFKFLEQILLFSTDNGGCTQITSYSIIITGSHRPLDSLARERRGHRGEATAEVGAVMFSASSAVHAFDVI
jgi:hypothetical protein